MSIVDPQSQTDPTFNSIKLYTRLSAAEVRHQLIELKGYQDEELPSIEVIRQRLNQLGYGLNERAFGWLEQHWSGSLLSSVDTVIKLASTLTFKGKNPIVTLINRVYHTGVKLTDDAMAEVEKQIQRLPNLKKWFVEIFCNSA